MGNRELRRVPLDFNWPVGEIWKGYENPNPGPPDCPVCNYSGYNRETKALLDSFLQWENHLVQEEVDELLRLGYLITLTHERGESGWIPRENVPELTAQFINSCQKHIPFGLFDSFDRFTVTEIRAKRLGVFGKCPNCKGRGELKLPRKMKKRFRNWEPYDPPAGEGYQLWETCTEGSPYTPVFATLDELATWCVENDITLEGAKTASKEEWLQLFTDQDAMYWASSLILASPPASCTTRSS
jgi:hypothetical protein